MTNKKIYIAKIFRAINQNFKNYDEDKLLTTIEASTKKEALDLARQEVIKYGQENLEDLKESDLEEFEENYNRFFNFDDMDFPETNHYEDLLNDFINNEENPKNELETENCYYTIKLFSKKVK